MAKNYYVQGNTIREMEPQPARRERQRDVPERRDLEKIRRQKRRREAVRRNQTKALAIGKAQMFFMMLCTFAFAAMAVLYIGVQAKITTSMKEISSLESMVLELKSLNDETYITLSTSLDLDYIRDVAVNELGMHYADEDQIVYYSVEKSSFMDQYLDIPD